MRSFRSSSPRGSSRPSGRLDLADDIADGLLSGWIGPDDAPPGYAPVARLLRSATGPARADELAGESAALAAFVTEQRRSVAGRASRTSLKVAGLVAVGVFALGTGVAAAATTGHLPAGMQAVAHDTLAGVGLHVPDAESKPADDEPATPTPDDGSKAADPSSGSSGVAPGVTGSTPGQTGATPGQTGDTPGQGGEIPGKTGATPGQSGATPGQSGTTPAPPVSTPRATPTTQPHRGPGAP